MTKHTPGPWFVGTGTSDQLGPVLAIVRKEESSGAAIAIIDTVPGDEFSQENARLIAAAPELLDALVEMVEIAEAQGHRVTRGRAAIAKATGEQA